MKIIERTIEALGYLSLMSLVRFFLGVFKASKKADNVLKQEAGFSPLDWAKEQLTEKK